MNVLISMSALNTNGAYVFSAPMLIDMLMLGANMSAPCTRATCVSYVFYDMSN